MNKKIFSATNSLITIVLIVGILVIVNIISSRYFRRFDFTQSKKYSLSEGTKNMMRNLPSNIIVRGYFTEDLPVQHQELIRYTKNMLNELALHSDGRMKVETIDPANLNEEKRSEMLLSGIRPIEAQVVREDRYEVKRGYMGIVLDYLDKQEVIPVVQDVSVIEYEIVSRISRLIRERDPIIGFLRTPKELEIPQQHQQDEYQNLKQILNQNYTVEDITNVEDNLFLDNIDMLVVIEDKGSLTEKELLAIDQYIISGRPAVFMAESYDINFHEMKKNELNPRLLDFFAHHNLKIGKPIIYDEQNQRIRIQRQEGFFQIADVVDYPFISRATNLNKKHPIISGINELSFVFATSIEQEENPNTNFEWLLKSSEKSYEYTGDDIDPTSDLIIEADARQGPFIMGGILSGRFDSYFRGQNIPYEGHNLIESGNNNRVLIFTDSVFASNSFLGFDNLSLILNSIDWAMQADELLEVRSKNVQIPRLNVVPNITKQLAKYINMFFIPVIIILIGLIRIIRRKRKEGKVYEG